MAGHDTTEQALQTTPELGDIIPIARPRNADAGRYRSSTLADVVTLTANAAIRSGTSAPVAADKVIGRHQIYVGAGRLYFHNGVMADAWTPLT